MPRHITPDGQTFDAPDHVVAALKTLEQHARDTASIEKLFGKPEPRVDLAARHADIRARQLADGANYVVPPLPPVSVAPKPVAEMSAGERWGAWRSPGS
jgi:hypothetical protein